MPVSLIRWLINLSLTVPESAFGDAQRQIRNEASSINIFPNISVEIKRKGG